MTREVKAKGFFALPLLLSLHIWSCSGSLLGFYYNDATQNSLSLRGTLSSSSTSRRQLISDKIKTTTIHDSVGVAPPVTIPSPDIITIPSTNPTTVLPTTSPITVPSTDPTTIPITYPSTNPVTTPPVTNPTTIPPPVPVTNPVTNPTTIPPPVPVTTPVTNPTTIPPPVPVTNPVTTPVTNPTTIPPPVPVTNPVTTPTTNPVNPVNPPATTYPLPPTMGGTPSTVPVSPVTGSGQSWCVAKSGATEDALQNALDYACGIGGADCSAIQMSGSCYNPNSLQSHASYAFNSYYQKNPVPTSCDFGGSATIVTTNPSVGTCTFPSSSSGSTLNPASSTNPLNPASSTNPGIGSTGIGAGPTGVTPTPVTPSPSTYGSGPGTGPSVLNTNNFNGTNTAFGSDSPMGTISSSHFCGPSGHQIMLLLVLTAALLLWE